jgi:hypothetical protein
MFAYFEMIIEQWSKYNINIGLLINDVINGMVGRA